MIPQDYFDKVKAYFDGDERKTWLWFKTPNPQFGLLSPLNMLKLGREKKVMQFINSAIMENRL